MRKAVLYIAMSLDGYIADQNGSVDWLAGQDENGNDMTTYDEFIKGIDTVIMGWNTYHQVVTELSPGNWLYEEMTTYVVTNRQLAPKGRIIFTKQDACALVDELRRTEGKDMWICGGASIVRQLVEKNMIDQYRISVIPTILGSGIRLFETSVEEIRLRLTDTKVYNGITELIYSRR